MHNANRKVASDALMHVTVGSPATVNSVLCCAWKAAQCFHLSQNSIFIEKARTFENATFTIATGRHETLIFWKLEASAMQVEPGGPPVIMPILVRVLGASHFSCQMILDLGLVQVELKMV